MTAPLLDDGNTDRRITVVLALCALVAFLVILGTPAVINASSTVDEVSRGNQLAACRSTSSAAVTDKRTEFDIARSDRDSVRADADTLLLALSRAAIFGDRDRVRDLAAQIDATDARLQEAQAKVDKADQALLDANAAYQDAIALSRQDPEGFLTDCEENSS